MAASLAAWLTPRGPSLAYQNTTDQSIAYSLCNTTAASANSPLKVPGQAPYVFPVDDVLPGTSLAVAGWVDGTNVTWASLFYQTTSGDIANVQYTCNNQTGQYETFAAVNLTGSQRSLRLEGDRDSTENSNGTSPDVLVPTGLAVTLDPNPSSRQLTGYRLFYHDRSSQVRMVHVSGGFASGQPQTVSSAVATSLGIHAGANGLFALTNTGAAGTQPAGDTVQRQPTLDQAAADGSFNESKSKNSGDNTGSPVLRLASITASGNGIQLSSLDVDGNWSTLLTTIESSSWAGPPASLGLATATDDTAFFFMGSNRVLQTLYWTNNSDSSNNTGANSSNGSSPSLTISTGQESSIADSINDRPANTSTARWPPAKTPSGAFAMAVAQDTVTTTSAGGSSSDNNQVWVFYQADNGTLVQAHGQRIMSPGGVHSSSSQATFTWDTTTVDQYFPQIIQSPQPSGDSSPSPATPSGICYGSCAHKALILGVVLALALAAAIVSLVAARTWWQRRQWKRDRVWTSRRGRARRMRRQSYSWSFSDRFDRRGGGGGRLSQVFGRFGRGWSRIGSRSGPGTYTARNTTPIAGMGTGNGTVTTTLPTDNSYGSAPIKLASLPSNTRSTLAEGDRMAGDDNRRVSMWPTAHALTTSAPAAGKALTPPQRPPSNSGRASAPLKTSSIAGSAPMPVSSPPSSPLDRPLPPLLPTYEEAERDGVDNNNTYTMPDRRDPDSPLPARALTTNGLFTAGTSTTQTTSHTTTSTTTTKTWKVGGDEDKGGSDEARGIGVAL